MENAIVEIPWVSFCISTYKRPLILKQQLESILQQQFKDFEIVISDNDPEKSAENVVELIGDSRLRYFANAENLGMMKSFNKSIERSLASYIVTITDDDPVVPEMLQFFYELINKHPGYGIYAGCGRTGKGENKIEIFDNKEFLYEILNPALTNNLLWSSCVIKKDVLTSIGGIPDYGSPHLADHAMLALCGTINGGVIINKRFSELISHDNNFSKGNIHLYSVACKEFYNLITNKVNEDMYIKKRENIVIKHLERWFIVASFSLRKHFTYRDKQQQIIKQIDSESQQIMKLKFMKNIRFWYYTKLIVFNLKRPLFFLNILN